MKQKNEVTTNMGGDGETHINIYSRGETELGRRLSHFAYSPFAHPTHGRFNSMEGYWYFIKLVTPDDRLRDLTGYAAKQLGKTLPSNHVPDFIEQINSGNWHKINQSPVLKELLLANTLPFDHYYVMGEGKVTVRPKGYEWLLEGFDEIRKRIVLQARSNDLLSA